MPAFTENLNLYLAGGGSTGTITPDEVVDIDRINQNFRVLDTAHGEIRADLDPLIADTAHGEIRADLDPLIADTGWVYDSSGIFTISPGWTLSTFRARRRGGQVAFYVSASRTGATISQSASGDIINTPLGTFLAGWIPSAEMVCSSGNAGRAINGFVSVSGDMTLASMSGTSGITSGDSVSLGGMFFT